MDTNKDTNKDTDKKYRENRWTLGTAKACLQRNGIKIKNGDQIGCLYAGIKVQGAIDYLVNHEKFIRISGDKKR